jgi:hypothetical protein
VFDDRHQHGLDRQVRMIDQRGNADQFLEEVVDRPSLGRLPETGAGLLEIRLRRDRVDEQNAMVGQEVIELLAHRRERRRLDLDEQVVAADVDHEAVEGNLELVAGPGIVRLQRGMERALVERADVWSVVDGADRRRRRYPAGRRIIAT